MKHYKTGKFIPVRMRSAAVREAQEVHACGADPEEFLAWANEHAAEELAKARQFRETCCSWIRHRELVGGHLQDA